jgi:hypothetical protein
MSIILLSPTERAGEVVQECIELTPVVDPLGELSMLPGQDVL